MGNCCSGTATVPSSSPPPSLVAGGVTPAPMLSQPEAEDVLAPSYQPRIRTASVPKPMLHSGVSSQDSNPRSRVVSAPQPRRSKSSVPQSATTRRPRPVAVPSMTSGLEQPIVGVSAPHVSYPIRNSPPSTLTEKQRKKLQVSRGKTIRASIEAGRNGYWRNLWSKLEFADKPLKSCVDVIHTDIVEVWKPGDTNGYLSSDRFKISMSHVVKDLAVPARGASRGPDRIISGDKFADWVYDAYRGRQEIVRCLMGYIVDLHVILDDFTKTAIRNVTDNDVLDVMNEHVRSGRRDSIHRDVRNFVTETYPSYYPTRFADTPKDLVLEKIIDLIRQYCDLPSGYI